MDLSVLNDMQKRAVLHTEGPLLIIAGAGSGKTRVLTHRVAYLIEECGVKPWNIMAITFTNKAAQEMKERIDHLVSDGADSVWVATFHSSCVRILRRFGDRIGYSSNFTIYDTEDSKQVIKDICRLQNIDTKIFKEKMIMAAISKAKDTLTGPEEYLEENMGKFGVDRIAGVYTEYQKRLKKSNALDFDDLIFKTVELLEKDPEVLKYYRDLFRYIMVDEYQDTNMAQFKLVSLLAGEGGNVCVVGDDDQSIYKFRGANIENILGFEENFKGAEVIKLEQNYRSTQNILDAANSVIKNNSGRKDKRLWTDNGTGETIDFRRFDQSFDEAYFVAKDISDRVSAGESYSDMAVLYRTNAQSRGFEERFVSLNIPYRLFGGVNFYSRKEVKDLLAYLKTIDNGDDDLSVKRIINVPKRGIGATTISKIEMHAASRGITFFEALEKADEVGIGRARDKILSFTSFIYSLRAQAQDISIKDLLDKVISGTGYVAELEEEDSDEAKARIENIEELISKVADYEMNTSEPTLSGFLEEVSLVADIDSFDENADYVAMMTIHSAKGLEFKNVYLVGMDDGLFPSYMCITADDPDELEEERRLCYVGITRAKKHLTMTSAECRMIRGELQYNAVSRFIKEIPKTVFGEQRIPESAIGKTERRASDTEKKIKAKEVFKAKPFEAKQFAVKGDVTLDYGVGDRVSHIKFGTGTVLEITSGGRDYEVKVDFDDVGVKKMFAGFAKLKKV
ncbi:MAG: DNA helicase PcrA [Lachnospiraceae bacterium]|nr:DNA helicase PcrA [Lachnospiraceae bacterium]